MATLTRIYEPPPTDKELAAYNDRNYLGVKVEAGLYLQVANDAKTIFAVGKFVDGAACGLSAENFPDEFDFWTWGEIDRDEYERIASHDDPDELISFVRVSADAGGWYRTKRDALAAALATQEA